MLKIDTKRPSQLWSQIMQLRIKQKTWKNKAFFTELSQLHELFKLRFQLR